MDRAALDLFIKLQFPQTAQLVTPVLMKAQAAVMPVGAVLAPKGW